MALDSLFNIFVLNAMQISIPIPQVHSHIRSGGCISNSFYLADLRAGCWWTGSPLRRGKSLLGL